MPRGASPKREHEYEELKHKFQKSGKYGKRANEVARELSISSERSTARRRARRRKRKKDEIRTATYRWTIIGASRSHS
jgi:hypothetical protein